MIVYLWGILLKIRLIVDAVRFVATYKFWTEVYESPFFCFILFVSSLQQFIVDYHVFGTRWFLTQNLLNQHYTHITAVCIQRTIEKERAQRV